MGLGVRGSKENEYLNKYSFSVPEAGVGAGEWMASSGSLNG